MCNLLFNDMVSDEKDKEQPKPSKLIPWLKGLKKVQALFRDPKRRREEFELRMEQDDRQTGAVEECA